MSTSICFHDVAKVSVSGSKELSTSTAQEFVTRTIRVYFADGTQQDIDLYGHIDGMPLEVA